MNTSRLFASTCGALLLGSLTTSPAAAQGQPLTSRSRTAGLEVRAHVQNATTTTPGGFDITVHGPPNTTYFLLVDTNIASIDNAFAIPGPVGSLSLAAPSVVDVLNLFTVPSGQTPGVIPPAGTQTLTSNESLPPIWTFPLFWQAVIYDAVGANPIQPGQSYYTTNAQTRVPVGPIAAPSTTGFTAGPTVAGSSGVVLDVEQADVDGDGDEDTLLVLQGGPTLLFRQHIVNAGAPPTYLPPITIPAPSTATTAEFADLDQDGFLDLIVGAAGTTYLSVFRNLAGTGTPLVWQGFGPGTVILQSGGEFHVNDIETADVDGDGLIDVAAATGLDPCVGERNLLFLNQTTFVGVPVLADVTQTRMPAQLEDTEDLEFLDFDLDGDLDILTGNFDGPIAIEGQNFIYTNDAGFYNTIAPMPVGTPAETLDVLAEDIDLDGAPDIYDATWLANEECGQPYNAIQHDQLLLNASSFGGAAGTFLDVSPLLPDNPEYVLGSPLGAWAATDAEAPRFPTDGVLGGAPVFKDFDHDGDVDIFIGLGSGGSTNSLVASPSAAVNRGIIILLNQQAQGAPTFGYPIPPFLLDLSLAFIGSGGTAVLPDVNDLELGDWLISDSSAHWWAQKDIGVGTRTGHFALKKNQG